MYYIDDITNNYLERILLGVVFFCLIIPKSVYIGYTVVAYILIPYTVNGILQQYAVSLHSDNYRFPSPGQILYDSVKFPSTGQVYFAIMLCLSYSV